MSRRGVVYAWVHNFNHEVLKRLIARHKRGLMSVKDFRVMMQGGQ